jgi:hypothetical protein
VVIVAEDWFTDPNLFRLLQTAEMLMPNMNSTQQGSSGNSANFPAEELNFEHHPHLGKYSYSNQEQF